MLARKKIGALLVPIIHGEKADCPNAAIQTLDLCLGAQLESKYFFNGEMMMPRHTAGSMSIEHHLINGLQLACAPYLIKKDLLISLSLVDRRMWSTGKSSAIPCKRMNPRVIPTIGLYTNLMLKYVRKTIPVGARDENDAIALVYEVALHILKHLCLPKLENEPQVLL